MALQFTTTAEAGALHGVKMMVYGPAGCGKTVLCATAPEPLILSAEAGLLSLRKFNIPVVVIRTLEDLYEAYRFVTESNDAKSFQTICLDSISEMAEVLIANLKASAKDPRQAYGELIDRMTQLIRAFRDLPNRHVYFSAKMEPIKDEMTGLIKYGPSMPGSKLGSQLPYFFDEVFKLGIYKDPKTSELHRYLQTQSDLQSDCKDRSGALAAMETPNLSEVIKKISG